MTSTVSVRPLPQGGCPSQSLAAWAQAPSQRRDQRCRRHRRTLCLPPHLPRAVALTPRCELNSSSPHGRTAGTAVRPAELHQVRGKAHSLRRVRPPAHRAPRSPPLLAHSDALRDATLQRMRPGRRRRAPPPRWRRSSRLAARGWVLAEWRSFPCNEKGKRGKSPHAVAKQTRALSGVNRNY